MQQQEVIISIPASHDILCGSGAQVNGHEGNKIFRQVVRKHHSVYARATTKPQKIRAAKLVFDELTKAGSRFLKKDPIFDHWYLKGDKAARDKISHCLQLMQPGEEAEPVPTPQVITKKLKTKDATPVKRNEPPACPTAVLSADNSMQPSPEHLLLEHERSEATMPLYPASSVVEATQPSLIGPTLLLHQTGRGDMTGFLQEIDPSPREELGFPSFETWCQANFGVSPSIEDNNALYPLQMEKCPTSMDALLASKQSAFQICEALGSYDVVEPRHFSTISGGLMKQEGDSLHSV